MSTASEMLELNKRFRLDPIHFVKSVLRAEPTDQQAQLLQEVSRPGAKVTVKSGHGTGKSSSLAWLVLWFLSNFVDATVPCTAPTAHQLEDILWKEIRFWHDRMDPFYKQQIKVTNDKVYIIGLENNFAVARTARKDNPDALQGFHAPNLLFLIDEASGVPEEVFERVYGALSTKDSRVILTGNPTELAGYFFESHNSKRDSFTCLTFSCLESPLVDSKYVEDMERDYGRDSDMFRVRVLGEFPKAGITQLISEEVVNKAYGKHLLETQYGFAIPILGCDVAWYGDDASSIYLRQGLMSRELFYGRGIDNMTLGGMLARFEDEFKAGAVFIDQGWGAGVIDYGRSFGRNWVPVAFGGSANDPRYANKRTEMWCSTRDWLNEGGSLPPIPNLKKDLMGPQYQFNPNGKIQLERKEDMKKRGLASPDRGDALAITFAEPVGTLVQLSPTGIPIIGVTEADPYNPFKGFKPKI